MKVGVVILNYNNYQITNDCFTALYKHCSINTLNTVIVENWSKNSSLSKICSFLKNSGHEFNIIDENNISNKVNTDLNVISIKQNVGYARGNNFGINFLLKQGVDYILILTNDIIIQEDILSVLISKLKLNSKLGFISPLLFKENSEIDYTCCRNSQSYFHLFLASIKFLKLPFVNKILDKQYILKYNDELIKSDLIYCDMVSGSCMLSKSSLWHELGGFDKNTYLYYEENILTNKLKEKDLKFAISTECRAIHLGGQSTKTMVNFSLLYAELDSLTYYLINYRKANKIIVFLIRLFKIININLLKFNNKYLK